MYILFWTTFIIILYSYAIYPVLMFAIAQIFKFLKSNKSKNNDVPFEPDVTLFIAAYNELQFIQKKIENSEMLDYPTNKLKQIWVTDGSNDGTPEELKKYKGIEVYHQPERNGKTGAINRGMRFVKTPIVVFSDANSMLNKDSIQNIVNSFKDENVGCVAGEKRIIASTKENAAHAGEGIYWQYESFIKKCESDIRSAVGAVGELFAIRTELFEEIESDTILDDFIISLRIALKGFRIKYEPNAVASESASINISEELKRKTRIAYGGFQAIGRLKELLNPMNQPLLSFQYISHKLLRWLFVPFCFILLFVSNLYLSFNENWNGLFTIFFLLQLSFYLLVILGWFLQKAKLNLKIVFAPYYLFIMNLSEILGLIRFIRKKQSVNWERAKRE